jgi:hypothetical protein
VAWKADEPQPGLVEVNLTDAEGRLWRFVDKWPIFSAEVLDSSSGFPRVAAIRCQVERIEVMPDGSRVSLITTSSPDGVESLEGKTEFHVRAEDVEQ